MSDFDLEREGEVNYAKPLPRALLRDSRISFAARGLFAFLWDLPGGWRPNIQHLTAMSPAGRDAITSMIKEIVAVGGMRIEHIKDGAGKMAGKKWVLISADRWATEFPLTSTLSPEERVFRTSGKPDDRETPIIGKTDTKVIQYKGSSNESKVLQSKGYSNKAAAAAASFSPQSKNQSLLIIKNTADEILFESLLNQFGLEKLEEIAQKLIANGERPYLSNIKKMLSPKKVAGMQQSHVPVNTLQMQPTIKNDADRGKMSKVKEFQSQARAKSQHNLIR